MQFGKTTIFLLIFLFWSSFQVNAQRKCATVEYMQQLKNVESNDIFEDWMKEKQQATPSDGLEAFGAGSKTIYQIPVVVHIIHNGEGVGSGSNISETQILSQLDVLNEDFRKLNADSINIPAEFKSLYSDIGFEFILAKRDPDNQSTNGITRSQGSNTSWSISQDQELKSHDFWPSEDYLNIWVAPLAGGWLGWAQYPETNLLEGLSPPYNNTTDGVVINYNTFGSIDKDPNANLQSRFNLGRTSTHEIGHFFGLRHIWGDGGCSVDDYVADTPTAESEYFNCPNLGASSTTCGSQDMFMNFMDYVDDVCMNLYSDGQKDRMLIVIENSPRRVSLTNSLGLIPPNCEDLAITKFINPEAAICNSQLAPIIEIKNNGICKVSATNISLFINNNLVANEDFEISLDLNQNTELIFSTIDLAEYGNLEFKAVIETVNGEADGFPENDTLTTSSLRAESVTSLFQDFSVPNPQWTVRTDQTISSLDQSEAVYYSLDNNAAVFDYYVNENSSDAYVSPKLSLGSTANTLIFDYSKSAGLDEFTVLISTDCGNTFTDTLYEVSNVMVLSDDELLTEYSPVAFYPSGSNDWQHVQIDLSAYVNQDVVFSFNGNSFGSNRIYFDNIQVVDQSYLDIALLESIIPAIACVNENDILIGVENKGRITISNLELEIQVGTTTSTVDYAQLNLMPGDQVRIPLSIPTGTDKSELMVSLLSSDDNNSNNSFTQHIISNNSISNIPLREKFDSSELPKDWFLLGKGTDQGDGWNLGNYGLEFNASNSPAKGLKEMILLPLLDLSDLKSASMHFDFAYAFDGFNEELLRVNVSDDCGESYETLFVKGGEELATRFVTTSWVPNGESDWKNIYVDLSNFAGRDNVQLVIEIISAQGNNAFVKNIELYASNILEPLDLLENTITTYPNPSTNGSINISFNLEKSQPAKLLIYNSQGSFIFEEEINTALNQTFEVSTVNMRNGMYFARLVGNNIDISRSFMVNQ
jgi:pregnancy-associated plasma protein-A/type IX secretion system substrate protein